MCGIAGFVDGAFPPSSRDADTGLVRTMCDVIRHRGPDDQGIHTEPGVGLGMRRLSIIDLSTGHQPIHNEDGSVWLVFNGEIYNYRELRERLERAGHVFYTSSDTETIVHAYEQWGEDAFERLRGMFGIALWDRNYADAPAGPGPHRHQAASLRPGGRSPVLRVRDQVAPRRRRRGPADRSRCARPLPVLPLHAARSLDLPERSQAASRPLPAMEKWTRGGAAVLADQRRGALRWVCGRSSGTSSIRS